MKTSMKFRTTCIAALCLLMLYSCVDWGHHDKDINTIYGYHNACSDPIILTMRSKGGTGIKEKTLHIPIGESYEMTYRGYDIIYPFNEYTWLEISNSKVIITQHKRDVNDELGSLYMYKSYEYTPQTNDITRYDYTFTDDFFKDGTPIEIE